MVFWVLSFVKTRSTGFPPTLENIRSMMVTGAKRVHEACMYNILIRLQRCESLTMRSQSTRRKQAHGFSVFSKQHAEDLSSGRVTRLLGVSQPPVRESR